MGDRSDEVTADPRSTEELLEETERLLSESGGVSDERPAGPSGDRTAEGSAGSLDASDEDATDAWWRSGTSDETDGDTGSVEEPSSSRSWRSRLRPSISLRSPTDYFSPKAFFAIVLALGAGFVVGSSLIPFAGTFVGIFAIAFLIGLVTSKRRYLEMAAAGSSVGVVAALAEFAMAAVAFNAGGRVVAVGITTGLLACLIGYYFGRDFRDGLSRDVE